MRGGVNWDVVWDGAIDASFAIVVHEIFLVDAVP